LYPRSHETRLFPPDALRQPRPIEATGKLCAIASKPEFKADSPMSFSAKLLTREQLLAWRETLRRAGKKLIATNGCFDLLHLGHVTYLENARQQGDILLVGVNSDDSVRALKGPNRPINQEIDRALVLAALESVDRVFIFPEKAATNFLSLAQPDIYIKGGDYTLETLNQDERRTVESGGGKIIIIPFVPGKSTTGILEKISRL
jgi:rfaE bifunctional protein nucleotidyltransferase chain/domain